MSNQELAKAFADSDGENLTSESSPNALARLPALPLLDEDLAMSRTTSGSPLETLRGRK